MWKGNHGATDESAAGCAAFAGAGYSQKEAATRLNLAATYVRKVTMEARRRTKTNTTAELVVKSMVK